MASKAVHLSQAEHNEKLAIQLVSGDYYDWACTAAFYSALHYVEANFFEVPEIVHTDDAYDKNRNLMRSQDINFGVHLFRETLVGGKYPNSRNAYRHLREVSEQVRYLKSQDKVACDFINQAVANRLVNQDLAKVKTELGF